MGNLKIITDSGSDIKRETAEKLGIRVIPISFTFDGENYFRDGIDLSINEFYEKLRESENVPKTSQVTPIQFEEVFNEEYDNGNDNLIVVTISSNGSGMYQNAVLTAQEIMDERGGEITVLDSQGFSSMYGAPVICAAKMISEGKSKEEIVSFLKDAFTTMQQYFVVGELEHLKKGGRINGATLVIANMLDIKPVLGVEGGVVVQKDKLRGTKRVWKKLVSKAIDNGADLNGRTVMIPNTVQLEKAEELKNEILESFPNAKTVFYDVGAVIGCHGGPDLVGFVYSDKYSLEDFEV